MSCRDKPADCSNQTLHDGKYITYTQVCSYTTLICSGTSPTRCGLRMFTSEGSLKAVPKRNQDGTCCRYDEFGEAEAGRLAKTVILRTSFRLPVPHQPRPQGPVNFFYPYRPEKGFPLRPICVKTSSEASYSRWIKENAVPGRTIRRPSMASSSAQLPGSSRESMESLQPIDSGGTEAERNRCAPSRLRNFK